MNNDDFLVVLISLGTLATMLAAFYAYGFYLGNAGGCP